MGISTAGHFPAITSTSYPTLTSHIVSAYNAQRIAQWSVSLRLFRSVVASAADGPGAGKRSKLMYVVQMSEFPDDTFVLIEDTHCETRASIRARHTFAVMQQAAAEAEARQRREQQQQQQQLKDDSQHDEQDEDLFGDSSMADALDGETEPTAQDGAKLDENKDSSAKETKTDADANEQPATTQQNGTESSIVLDGQPLMQADSNAAQADPSLAADATSTGVSFLPDADKPTRWTLFVTSLHYTLMLSRLNLPAPLGAPSMGDGGSAAPTSAGPGAWLPRGQPITIQGAVYDVPSATGFGSGGAEWRVRLGMIQSRGASTQNVGAVVEAEYLPLVRLASDAFLSSYLQNLFPAVITQPGLQANGATTATHGAPPSQQAGHGGIANPVPTPEQWQEVIPASNQAWMDGAGISPLPKTSSADETDAEAPTALPLQQKDPIGWRGKERGRRLAYLYITLLRNQSVI